jgi:hypothetical protein
MTDSNSLPASSLRVLNGIRVWRDGTCMVLQGVYRRDGCRLASDLRVRKGTTKARILKMG